jgi:hypothetical protein
VSTFNPLTSLFYNLAGLVSPAQEAAAADVPGEIQASGGNATPAQVAANVAAGENSVSSYLDQVGAAPDLSSLSTSISQTLSGQTFSVWWKQAGINPANWSPSELVALIGILVVLLIALGFIANPAGFLEAGRRTGSRGSS